MGLFNRKSSSGIKKHRDGSKKYMDDDDHVSVSESHTGKDNIMYHDDQPSSVDRSVPKEVTTEKYGSKMRRSMSLRLWPKSRSKKKRNDVDRSPSTSSVDDSYSTQHRSRRSSTTAPGRDGPPPTRTNSDRRCESLRSFRASQLVSKITETSQEDDGHYQQSFATAPPDARTSAFMGPTRFDWIDVEYNAITKIQSTFRRYIVLRELEERGMTTSYIRNRRRQRRAAAEAMTTDLIFCNVDNSSNKEHDHDTSLSNLDCCAIGLVFDGNDDDDKAELERQKYQDKTRQQAEREDYLRRSYFKQQGRKDSVQKIASSKNPSDLLLA